MHPCLTIVEMQYEIFRQVRLDGLPIVTNPTLAGLARTCRSFSGAALDVLWEELASIVYLIRCLPRNLWSIERISAHKQLVSFQRTMSFTDWDIFRTYALRVRSLSTLEGETLLGDNVILALSHPPYNGPLIPHLKVLCWTSSHKGYTPLFPVLFTRTLVDVTLPYFALQSPGTTTQFTSNSPLLKRLCIEPTSECEAPHTDDRRTLTEMITYMRFLESLECMSPYRMLDEAAILHLSRLSSFDTLALEFQVDLLSETLRCGLIPPAFGSLQSLTLRVDVLTTLTSLLEVMYFQPQEVSFTVKDIPTSNALRSFFNTLVNACDQEQLSDITLEAGSEDWLSDGERERVSLSTFQPLFAFQNIYSFQFDVMCSISFDDDAVQLLADCWPWLTRLSINIISGWGIESQVTHRGLLTLLSHCPALKCFALAVDFTEIDHPLIEMPGSYMITMSPCHTADFITSAIRHPPAIIAFLKVVCPELSRVSSFCSDDTDEMFPYSQRWGEVHQSLCRRRGGP